MITAQREPTTSPAWKDFVAHCKKTRKGPTELMALGLAGETGEVVDHIKKLIYHNRDLGRAHLIEELGDVLFYYAMILEDMNITLYEVMQANGAKLDKRYPDGFVPGGGVRE